MDVAGMPTQGVRTAITLVLLIHFFCLLVVFGGLYFPSQLQTRLLAVFRPYTQVLALDLNKEVHFAPYTLIENPQQDPFYADTQIRLELAASGEPVEIVLPSGTFPGGLEHGRQQILARFLGDIEAAQNENASNHLASRIFAHYQAGPGDSLSVTRRIAWAPPFMRPINDGPVFDEQPTGSETALEVYVIAAHEDGHYDTLRMDQIGSVAPVDPEDTGSVSE